MRTRHLKRIKAHAKDHQRRLLEMYSNSSRLLFLAPLSVGNCQTAVAAIVVYEITPVTWLEARHVWGMSKASIIEN